MAASSNTASRSSTASSIWVEVYIKPNGPEGLRRGHRKDSNGFDFDVIEDKTQHAFVLVEYADEATLQGATGAKLAADAQAAMRTSAADPDPTLKAFNPYGDHEILSVSSNCDTLKKGQCERVLADAVLGDQSRLTSTESLFLCAHLREPGAAAKAAATRDAAKAAAAATRDLVTTASPAGATKSPAGVTKSPAKKKRRPSVSGGSAGGGAGEAPTSHYLDAATVHFIRVFPEMTQTRGGQRKPGGIPRILNIMHNIHTYYTAW